VGDEKESEVGWDPRWLHFCTLDRVGGCSEGEGERERGRERGRKIRVETKEEQREGEGEKNKDKSGRQGAEWLC
jgi:hypothetical protein